MVATLPLRPPLAHILRVTPLQRTDVSPATIARWSDAGRLYALVDACDQPAVPVRCRASDPGRARSLYRGRAEEELWAIAPYLFRADADTLVWLRDTVWHEPWGVLVLSGAGFEALYRHFRRFLVVESPAGESWYFRYYDPRVLSRYLTAPDVDLPDFFGPVDAFAIGRPDGSCELLWQRIGEQHASLGGAIR